MSLLDSALHRAAQRGDAVCVARLLARDSTMIDDVDGSGLTALHCAAQGGHEEVVTVLLANNPELIGAEDGWTPLHHAVHGNHVKIVSLLAAYKPDVVDAVAQRGMTALHLAARAGYDTIVAELVPWSKLLDAKDTLHRTALHYAAIGGHEAVVAHLLAQQTGMPLNAIEAQDLNGMTALSHAAVKGNERLVALMLQEKPALANSVVSNEGKTLLHYIIGAPGSFSQAFVKRVWELNKEALHVGNYRSHSPFDVAVWMRTEWAIEYFQWHMSLDEISRAFKLFDRPLKPIRELLEQQCEELRQALHPDILSLIYSYLGLGFAKKSKVSATLPRIHT